MKISGKVPLLLFQAIVDAKDYNRLSIHPDFHTSGAFVPSILAVLKPSTKYIRYVLSTCQANNIHFLRLNFNSFKTITAATILGQLNHVIEDPACQVEALDLSSRATKDSVPLMYEVSYC